MGKKCLFVCNSYPIQPRITKIAELAKELNIECFFLIWDLEGKAEKLTEKSYVHQANYGYGHPVKKLFDSISFRRKMKKIISNEDIDFIYAFQFDSMFCTRGIDARIIYDVADMPIVNVKFIDVFLKVLEKFNCKRASSILLGSRFFEPYYEKYKEKCFVVENRPDFSLKPIEKIKSNKIRITFLGIIRYYEILKNLFIAAKDLNIDVNVYGGGKDEQKVLDFIKTNKTEYIHFYGQYSSKDIPEIYANSDFIWAVYPSKGLNEKLAISNKYFESIYYQVPCIFDKDTMVGKLAEELNVGLTVEARSIENIKYKIEQNIFKNFDFQVYIEPFCQYTSIIKKVFNK